MIDIKHVFHLSKEPAYEEREGGFRIKAVKKRFPILQGMSIYKLVLHKGGIREPHWHPNADELGYCLNGKALITIYGNGDKKETFLVMQGEAFFIPSGYFHHIENLAAEQCELILQFSHEQPEEFGVSSALGFLSDSVLGNTWNVAADTFKCLKRSNSAIFITKNSFSSIVPEEAKYSSPYKYNLDASQPLLSNEGGHAKMARNNTWPILINQALYSLTLTEKGMREPHWHPDTAELGYVQQGRARMSVLDPEGNVDTYIIEKGDIYFIPKAYPHHIENLDNSDLHILIFFDKAMPGDIGFSGSIRAYSNEVLGSVMSIDPSFFDKLSKYYKDLFIVQKINPLD